MSSTPTRAPDKPAQDEALRKALASGERPPRAGAAAAVHAFAWRGMLKIKHVPEQLIDVTVTPILLVLMFTYLFGGAIAGSTSEYLQFVLPGVLVMSVLFTTVYSGVALNTDVTKGVIDRFRSLPIWRPSPLIGAVLGDSVRYLLGAAVIIALGLALGYRPDGGVIGVLAGVALVVIFAFGFSWIFASLGLLLRAPNAVTNAGFMALFPLTFLTNVFVEPETLPGPLETFVNLNPISHLVTATRALMDGEFAATETAVALGTAAVLTAVFAPLTSHLYRRK